MKIQNPIFRIIGPTLALLSLFAADAGAQTSPRYVNKELHYSFAPPVGWKQGVGSFSGSGAVFTGPVENAFAVNVNVNTEAIANATPAQYIQAARQTVSKMKNVTLTDDKATTLAGLPAHTWHLKLHYGREIENKQVIAIYNKRAYIITFTALPTNIKKYEPTFNKMLGSFKFEK